MMRGEQPDWSAVRRTSTTAGHWPSVPSADDLVDLWNQWYAAEGSDPDWQTAELAVHSWDLAHALGRSTGELDPAVAEQGLAFMKANLRAEMRG